jgi:hypothetical protein
VHVRHSLSLSLCVCVCISAGVLQAQSPTGGPQASSKVSAGPQRRIATIEGPQASLLPSSTRGADFNSDGKSDILWQHPTTGELSVWFS